jgi:hypothetical protein
MSDPDATTKPRPGIDPLHGLPFILAGHLVPLFTNHAVDDGHARLIAISAIGAYEPETQADYVNATRTIAFSMAAVALLGHAAGTDVTMREKMQAYGRANALNRSADQSERTMFQRRRYLAAKPATAEPLPAAATPEPDEFDMVAAAAQIDAAVNEAIRTYRADHAPRQAEPAPPQPTAPKAAIQQPTAAIGPAVLFPATPAAAIHYTGPRPGSGQRSAPPHKAGLLQHSAIQRVAAESAVQHSV